MLTVLDVQESIHLKVYVGNAKISVYVETPHLFNIFIDREAGR